MGFENQLNMLFHIIISYTCDVHLKLEILNLMDIKKYPNYLLKESFPLQPFASKFQNFEIFMWFFFHQIDIMNMYLHKGKHVLLTSNVWNQWHHFMHSFNKKL